jgi:hypothetical protein
MMTTGGGDTSYVTRIPNCQALVAHLQNMSGYPKGHREARMGDSRMED